ncbi:MAG: hypothetical protein HQL21_04050 [Candidatus Omnitrophica bacterium]|nr:hypothetical protein [Candidatus Omnitrophota bacterium]
MEKERFLKFSETDRLGHIASEVSRYRSFLGKGQGERSRSAALRALELIDFALEGLSDISLRELLERARKSMSCPDFSVEDAESLEQALLARKFSEIG